MLKYFSPDDALQTACQVAQTKHHGVMFEHRTSPLLSRRAFYHRVGKSFLLGFLVITFALAIGMAGYHFFEKMEWVDAFANAAMILSGMGPFGPLATTGGKIFAGFYALFSGLIFITVSGILLAPVAHRAMHKFHLETEKKKRDSDA
jgi:hypothetical protein